MPVAETVLSQVEIERSLRQFTDDLTRMADEYQPLCDTAIRARHEAERLVTRSMLELKEQYRTQGDARRSVDLLEREATDLHRNEVYRADGAEAAVKASERQQRVLQTAIDAYRSLLASVRGQVS